VLFVEITLLEAISVTGAGRDNFDDQVGSPLEALPDDVQPFVRDEHHVGLHRAPRRQDHVERGDSRLAQAMGTYPGLQPVVKTVHDLLMEERRGG
jgi:hypothetical protein